MFTKKTHTYISNMDKASEFSLYVNNESGLYFQMMTNVEKLMAGKYDKALMNLRAVCYDAACLYPTYLDKRYVLQGAALLIDELMDEIELGNYKDWKGRV